MPISIFDALDLRRLIEKRAKALGFDALKITAANLAETAAQGLSDFVAAGRHGTMAWLAETMARRGHPNALWPEAKSAIVVGLNYGPESNPLASLAKLGVGTVSVYARGRDYHEIIKGKLKELAGVVARRTEAEVKVFVDTAPLMEKPLAMAAGLGWQGKHTNLVSRDYGSWLFLGVILSAADLPTDAPHENACGSCQACLDICPTSAFPAPYQIDARRCISYLTIEHKGVIDAALRPLMGNRIYGCDDCLAVCPWNKFAEIGRETKLHARDDLNAPPLAELAALDDAGFRARFSGSPIKRIGRDRFIRNVLIAIGNSGDAALADPAQALLEDAAPLVRGMAVWALRRLLSHAVFDALAARHATSESDAAVRAEWAAAQSPSKSAVER